MDRNRTVVFGVFVLLAVCVWVFPRSPGFQTAFAQQAAPAGQLAQAGGGAGGGEGEEEEPPPPQFVGAERCKVCHNKEDVGAQYAKWSETKHAQAYQVLGTDDAREVAKSADVEGNPQEAGECLKCHQTAYGEDEERLHAKFDKTQGVQCESCHGAGGDYWKKEIMKDKEAAIEKGLIIPTEETCRGCHNAERPGAKPDDPEFCFEEMFEKIAHPIPSEEDKQKQGEGGAK